LTKKIGEKYLQFPKGGVGGLVYWKKFPKDVVFFGRATFGEPSKTWYFVTTGLSTPSPRRLRHQDKKNDVYFAFKDILSILFFSCPKTAQ